MLLAMSRSSRSRYKLLIGPNGGTATSRGLVHLQASNRHILPIGTAQGSAFCCTLQRGLTVVNSGCGAASPPNGNLNRAWRRIWFTASFDYDWLGMDEDELVDAGAELDWELEEEVLKGAAPDHLLRESSLTLLFSQGDTDANEPRWFITISRLQFIFHFCHKGLLALFKSSHRVNEAAVEKKCGFLP